MNESKERALLRINSKKLSEISGLSVETICKAYNKVNADLPIKIWPTYENLRMLCKFILEEQKIRSRAMTNAALGARKRARERSEWWYSSKVLYKKG